MKTHLALSACAALLLAPLTSTHAQAWQPILDIDGQSDRAMLVDPFSPDPSLPNLIVAGDVYGVQNGFLHRLSQQDSTIAPLDPDNHGLLDTCGLAWDGNPSSPGYGNVYLAGFYSRQTRQRRLGVQLDAPAWHGCRHLLGACG